MIYTSNDIQENQNKKISRHYLYKYDKVSRTKFLKMIMKTLKSTLNPIIS